MKNSNKIIISIIVCLSVKSLKSCPTLCDPTGEPRGFSRVAAGFSSYDRDFRLPLVLGQGSPIIHSSCEGELGVALESLQGKGDLI